jgi:flavorubredoxin
VIDPSKIDYLVANHLEPDHSGSIPLFKKEFPGVKIFAGKMAEKGFKKYFPGIEFETVKTGDSLSLGKRSLQFIETPMIHWPDSIFSYVPEEELLFSMDGFGQHIATSGRFDDEVDLHNVMFEAEKYYANLLTHLSPLISATLKKVSDMNLQISMIAPSHGIIWRKHISTILDAYQRWSSGYTRKKIIIVYDTMWKSTEKIASAIADTISDHGIEVDVLKLRENHRSDIMAALLEAGGLFLGSPTIHRNLFPTVADFICYMRGLKPGGKPAAAFGSYGWSGEGVDLINTALSEIGFDVIKPGAKALFLPDEVELETARNLAKAMVDKLK